MSVVASDGGNNRLAFDPFSIQLVRVVDSYGQDFLLDAVSPSTDTDRLSEDQFDAAGRPITALGRMMEALDVRSLSELSPMIPSARDQRESPWSVPASWVMVYRDLCEWAVLHDLITQTRFTSDTLIVRDGLLRSKVFARDLFVRSLGEILRKGMHRVRAETNRRVFLVGLAKHSRVIERYRLAMLVEDSLPAGAPRYVRVPRDIEARAYSWPEYARGVEQGDGRGELPKFVLGDLYLVRFGSRSGDPVWPVDIFSHHGEGVADEALGFLLADAVDGFPVPYYPRCLQRAHEHAQIVDLDLQILQDEIRASVRELIPHARRESFDAGALVDADPAAGRYG